MRSWWIGILSSIGRYFVPISCAVIAALIGCWSWNTDFVKATEVKLTAQRQVWIKPAKPSSNISVLEFSSADARKESGDPNASVMPRRVQGELITLLKRAGAKVVCFDQFFDHKVPEDDPAFLKAIKAAPPLKVLMAYTPVNFGENDELITWAKPAFWDKDLAKTVWLHSIGTNDTGGEIEDVPFFDTDDKTKALYPHEFLTFYLALSGMSLSDVVYDPKASTLRIGDDVFDINSDFDYFVNFSEKTKPFNVYDYSEALKTLRAGDPEHLFKGQGVLVGQRVGDVHPTAIGNLPGVEIVAFASSGLFQRGTPLPKRISYLFKYGFAILVSLATALCFCFRYRTSSVGTYCGVVLIYVLMPLAVLKFFNIQLEVVCGFVALFACSTLCMVLKSVFPTYFPVQANDELEGTVLVLDLKNSTLLLSQLPTQRGKRVLAGVLGQGGKVVHRRGGEIVADTGDGFIAFWPAKKESNHATLALATLAELQKLEPKLSSQFEVEISFTFGVESGVLLRRGETVLGLVVHIATRLQTAARTYNRSYFVGPSTMSRAASKVHFADFEDLDLKGVDGIVRSSADFKWAS